MNTNNIIVLDFETGGKNPHYCQPTQLAAVGIDARRLEIDKDRMFISFIKPKYDPEECKLYNLDPIEDEALALTGISIENLESAPSPSVVWNHFQDFVNQYNYRKDKWTAPIKAGYNSVKYDEIIIDRLCGGHNRFVHKYFERGGQKINKRSKELKEPYGFGPWDNDRGEETLFAPRDNIDIMKDFVWPWTENLPEVKSLSLSAILEWLGMSVKGSHDAKVDVLNTAELLVRFLKLTRNIAIQVNWRGKNSI